ALACGSVMLLGSCISTRFGGLRGFYSRKTQRIQWHTVNKRCPSSKQHKTPSSGHKLKKSTVSKNTETKEVQQTVSCGEQGSIHHRSERVDCPSGRNLHD